MAVEIIGADSGSDVLALIRDYLEAGTSLLWVLDLRSNVTAVFRPGQPVRFLDENDVLDGEDVLPGFRLPLKEIFR